MSDAHQPERRKQGRPTGTTKVDEPRTSVSTWIPARDHDRLIRLANEREQSVSKTLRELLRERLR